MYYAMTRKRENRSAQELFDSREGALYIMSYPQNSLYGKGACRRCSVNPQMHGSHSGSVFFAGCEWRNVWCTVKIAAMPSHTLYSLTAGMTPII